MATSKTGNSKKKYSDVVINHDLDKYNDKVLFPEKLAKANEAIRELGIPAELRNRNRN